MYIKKRFYPRTLSKVLLFFKYIFFIFKYFKYPFQVICDRFLNNTISIIYLKNGGFFQSFDFGSADTQLAQVWIKNEYDISPNEIRKCNIIIDIGSHIGLFSVFAGILNPNCKIYSYELSHENYQKLLKNIESCNVNNIIPFNMAITGKSGYIDYYPGRNCSEFSITKIQFSNNKEPIINKKIEPINKIYSNTLNNVIKKNNITQIDFLKLDCEGAEFEILYSLSYDNINKIYKMGLEYHEFGEYKICDLIKYLSKYGYVKCKPTRPGIGFLQYTRMHKSD